MDKTVLQHQIELHKSIREIAKVLNTSPTNTRYWLKKHNLSTTHTPHTDLRVCPCCGGSLPKESFYRRRGKEGSSVYCKGCTSDQSLKRQRALKLQCIEYKGGQCGICGYSKYPGALEFHHIDPGKKDFTIGRATRSSLGSLRSELDKCALLCANCHREVHGKVAQLVVTSTVSGGPTGRVY